MLQPAMLFESSSQLVSRAKHPVAEDRKKGDNGESEMGDERLDEGSPPSRTAFRFKRSAFRRIPQIRVLTLP